METLEETISAAEAAKRLQISKPTVLRLIKAGEIRAYHIAGAYRVPPDAIQEYIERSRVGEWKE